MISRRFADLCRFSEFNQYPPLFFWLEDQIFDCERVYSDVIIKEYYWDTIINNEAPPYSEKSRCPRRLRITYHKINDCVCAKFKRFRLQIIYDIRIDFNLEKM